MLWTKDPGGHLRMPRKDELELLGWILQTLVHVHKRDKLANLADFGPDVDDHARLSVGGSLRRPEVTVSVFRPSKLKIQVDDGEGIEPPSDMQHLPRCGRGYLVGLYASPMRIDGDSREVRFLLIVDEESRICHGTPMLGSDLSEAAEDLFGVLGGSSDHLPEGLPDSVTFTNERLFETMREGLETLGVRCEFEPNVAEIDDLFEEMIDALERGGPNGGGEDPERVWVDPNRVPEPCDLEGWKQLDQIATDFCANELRATGYDNQRAWKKYFGVAVEDTNAASSDEASMKLAAYGEWYTFHYRSKPRSRTWIENCLAAELPAGLGALLEERSKAIPSIYRVAGVVAGESVDLVDVFTAEELTVHDHMMSAGAPEGMFFVLRVYRAGEFWFPAVLGPGLPPLLIAEVLAFLQDEVGLKVDDAAARDRAAHLFGRLWEWLGNRLPDLPPRLQNTDGHEIRWHSATFTVDDPACCAAALDAESAFDGTGHGEWNWGKEVVGGIEHTLLGSLTLIDDRLVLEVNSRERFETARRLLERLPGVRFDTVTESPSISPRERDRSTTAFPTSLRNRSWTRRA